MSFLFPVFSFVLRLAKKKKVCSSVGTGIAVVQAAMNLMRLSFTETHARASKHTHTLAQVVSASNPQSL